MNCNHRWGFPCCVWSPLLACHRHYPGRSDGACSLVPLHRQRPSLWKSQVGSCNCCFGTCSAFTLVMACTLAESPSDPFHRKLRQLCCLRRRFDCYRVERTSSRAGVAPAEVQRLSRRTFSSIRLQILFLSGRQSPQTTRKKSWYAPSAQTLTRQAIQKRGDYRDTDNSINYRRSRSFL